jgi:hypothetical protein
LLLNRGAPADRWRRVAFAHPLEYRLRTPGKPLSALCRNGRYPFTLHISAGLHVNLGDADSGDRARGVRHSQYVVGRHPSWLSTTEYGALCPRSLNLRRSARQKKVVCGVAEGAA